MTEKQRFARRHNFIIIYQTFTSFAPMPASQAEYFRFFSPHALA